ncbi:MAG: RagB/SusD family nutrient uptake outer membrane protein [Alistipes sp.]|nr:RagB/SusD family nutrient uptake outer membrane protein [Alistipes sp.]
MKKTILIILSAIALVGCTLEEQLYDSSPETFYQTVPQCQTGLNGCYIPLRSIYANGDYFEACEVAADLIYHNSNSYYDAMCNYTQSIPRFGNTLWTQGYLGVMRCNAIYAAIERSPLTDEEKAPLLAECVVLRAFYYYILTINFGDVPYYFEEVTDANNDRISQMPRKPAKELRAELMDQLHYWLLEKQALPMIKTYDPANNYRIGAMVGLTIAGKLAMWNKRFDKAIEFFAPIEKVYGTVDAQGEYKERNALMGYDLRDVMFRNRYTDESILELPGYAKDYGLRVTQNLASRCTPMRSSTVVEGAVDDEEMEEEEGMDLSQKDDFYNGIRIPELGINARTTSPYRPTTYMYRTLMPYNSKDKRRAVYDPEKCTPQEAVEIEGGGGWMAWCYKGWKDKNVDINDPANPPGGHFFNSTGTKTGAPFLGDKFWCPGMIYTQDSNNLKIFRFAHVILDLAEANMRCGNWEKAFGYLNASKQRAGREDMSGGHSDEIQFMKELQEESARELFGEFTRRHNLVRWGIWYDQVVNYAKYPSGSSSKPCEIIEYVKEGPCREYYPIPDQQIVLSNYNLSNPEYDKYGL